MSDKVLGLDLSNFNRQVKLKPELRDDHKIIAVMSNDLWFRIDEVNEETSTRRNAEKTEAQPEALTLRTKVKANKWLHFTLRVGARGGGADAFQRGPSRIAKIHQYLLESLDHAELREDKVTEFMDRLNRKILEKIWTENVQGRDGHARADSMVEDWEQYGPRPSWLSYIPSCPPT